MRVCMLAYTFYESDNRVRRYCEMLASRGDEVDVIALRRKGQSYHQQFGNVNLYRIQRRVVNERRRLSYLFKLISFLIKSAILLSKNHLTEPYELIHVHSVPDFEAFATLLPKLMGSKVILDIHDIVPEFYATKFKVKKTALIFKILLLIERLSISFSDHVIISNDLWQQSLVRRSVRPEKCSVVLNYPDLTIFCRRNSRPSRNTFIMLYPGTLNWHQGVDLAIRAVGAIRDKIPHVEFHIYGEGSERARLVDLATKLGLKGKVCFKEFVPMDQVAEVMANADVGIVPKRASGFGNEAFSTKVLEFMALGVPVIVSATKIDRYYFDSYMVKFFQPENVESLAEAMLLVYRDEQLRNQLVTNAFRYIQENNWQTKGSEYLALVDSLAGRQSEESSPVILRASESPEISARTKESSAVVTQK